MVLREAFCKLYSDVHVSCYCSWTYFKKRPTFDRVQALSLIFMSLAEETTARFLSGGVLWHPCQWVPKESWPPPWDVYQFQSFGLGILNVGVSKARTCCVFIVGVCNLTETGRKAWALTPALPLTGCVASWASWSGLFHSLSLFSCLCNEWVGLD